MGYDNLRDGRVKNWFYMENDLLDREKTNLNNVNTAGGEEVVENSREAKKEKKVENKEDINDIRKKIRKSLEEKDKESFSELKDWGKEDGLFEKDNNPEDSYFKDNKTV